VPETNFDVLICGGGMTGAGLASALAQQGLKIAVFEAQKSVTVLSWLLLTTQIKLSPQGRGALPCAAHNVAIAFRTQPHAASRSPSRRGLCCGSDNHSHGIWRVSCFLTVRRCCLRRPGKDCRAHALWPCDRSRRRPITFWLSMGS
jgi:choline dehydrogenase-like flavoprotein